MSVETAEITEEAVAEVLDIVEEFLDETLAVLDVDETGFEASAQFVGGRIEVTLKGTDDDVALLIGRRGHTLDAIQYLANAVVISQVEVPIPVDIDAEGYRERRAVQLRKIADRAVGEVMRRGRYVELDPMTASERKTIHLYIKDHPDVRTESTGVDPNRRLVIHPRAD